MTDFKWKASLHQGNIQKDIDGISYGKSETSIKLLDTGLEIGINANIYNSEYASEAYQPVEEDIPDEIDEPVAATDDDPTDLSVSLPDNLRDEVYSNLEKIIVSKQTLMRHAFRSKGISVARKDGQIIFSGFNASDGDHTGAYLRYITLLTKFAFCCFIIRIGMIGAEYKKARKILLENLTGNSSWKNGAPEKATNVENPAEGSASTETVEETEAAINDGMV